MRRADYSARHSPDWGDSAPLRCPRCALVLAVREGGHVLMRHKGRVALDPAAILCDRKGCGGVWRATDDAATTVGEILC